MKREEALGEAPAFLDFQFRLSRAAKVHRPLLIIGERGTGKELAAARAHYLSPRWEAPLVALNCAALNTNLIETELFGHEAGAFTGAGKTKAGRFEKAHRGTLFLDEIGLVPLEVQEKILRVVEYGEYERVGGSTTLEADVRLIGATNADLPELCRQGKFKKDLLDRLSFEALFLPPLRRRREDILPLAQYFAVRMAGELGIPVPPFSAQAREQLLAYPWPGNIRELKNTVERGVYRSEGNEISHWAMDPFLNPFPQEEDSPSPSLAAPGEPDERGFDLEGAREALEKDYIDRALNRTRGSQIQAAALLGVSYDRFRGLLKKHDLKLNNPAEERPE
ncbi:MAG: sigma 54-interacting transcriptional regulator [Spirochaetales bacterium]|jgi:psp operon transcriptional activator|nr:sigma 54-interacting transcriptional regulator [Spirochaetales bacterium]